VEKEQNMFSQHPEHGFVQEKLSAAPEQPVSPKTEEEMQQSVPAWQLLQIGGACLVWIGRRFKLTSRLETDSTQ
jgi:hypothetical protein